MKVLIVDDETIIRVGLKSMIQWEKEGFSLVGEARNGEEALETMANESIDIIITDLKMPSMDGITLIKELKERGFQGEIIVLSNYDDFTMVKEAMSEGAMDYLLKISIDASTIIDVLNQAKGKVLAKQEKQAMIQKKAHVEKYQKRLLIQDFVRQYLSEQTSLEFLLKGLKDIGINRERIDSQCIIMYIHEGESKKLQNQGQFIEGIINLLEDWAATQAPVFVCSISYKEYIIYNLSQHALSHKKLEEHMNLYINSQVVILTEDIKDFPHLKERMESFHDQLFYSKDVGFNDASLDYRSFTYKLQQLLEAKEKEPLLNLLENTLELARHETWYPKHVKNFILYLLDLLNQYLISWGCPVEERVAYAGEELNRLHRIEECKELAQMSIQQVFLLLGGLKKNYYRSEVIKLIEYMHGHHQEKITLSQLANHVNLNESYLCRIFKKDVGQSITDYLNALRIDKAKELLLTTDLLSKEVGEAVGIHNPYYFNRLFKKLTDITPTTYREQNSAI